MKRQALHQSGPTRIAVPVVATLAAILHCSCIQPPPPRTYNPKVASHLRSLSHDKPVTPMPSAYGCGYYGYYSCYGY